MALMMIIIMGTGGNNLAMQLVLDGLKLQPCNPTFLDARDAILAADIANNNGVNQCLIWETFARRGLGFSAQVGGTEAFDIPDICSQALKIDKTSELRVEAGENLTYNISIKNDTENAMTNLVVTDELPVGIEYLPDASNCPNITENNGILTIQVDMLDAGENLTCSYNVKVANDPFSIVLLEDDVENGTMHWNINSDQGAAEWNTNSSSFDGSLAWFAADIDSECDQYLTSAETHILGTGNPALSFWHRYNTEATWDGGVVEISTNNGTTWTDLGGNMIQNGYNLTLEVNPASPITGRPAFSGSSQGFIQTIIDLSDFAEQDVMIRFRFGCDGFVGGEGWYIDNILLLDDFTSITNSACLSSNGGDNICSEATTIVTGEFVNATSKLNGLSGISVSPNPAKGKIFLSFDKPIISKATISLMNLNGQVLSLNEINSQQRNFVIDLGEFTPGVYFLKVATEEGSFVEKLIKQ